MTHGAITSSDLSNTENAAFRKSDTQTRLSLNFPDVAITNKRGGWNSNATNTGIFSPESQKCNTCMGVEARISFYQCP